MPEDPFAYEMDEADEFGKRARKGGGRNRKGGGRNRKGAAPAVEVDPVVGAGGDEAAAVGDPHLVQNTGSKEDLCCDSGICKPCPVALVSASQVPEDPFAYEMDEFDEFGKRARKGGGRNRKGGGRNRKGAVPAVEVDPVVGAGGDDAAAVGDPHLSQDTGAKEDLCCEGGICKPCPVALMSDKQMPEDPFAYEMDEFDEFGKRARKGGGRNRKGGGRNRK